MSFHERTSAGQLVWRNYRSVNLILTADIGGSEATTKWKRANHCPRIDKHGRLCGVTTALRAAPCSTGARCFVASVKMDAPGSFDIPGTLHGERRVRK